MKKLNLLSYSIFLTILTIGLATNILAFEVCKTGSAREIKWFISNVKYWVNPTGGSSGSYPAIISAMETWSNVDTANFIFSSELTSSIPSENDRENTIGFVSMGINGSLAINTYWYYPNTGEMFESDIEINMDFPWTTNGSPDAFDVQNVVTHELGHSLCLGDLDNGSDSEKTMYGYCAEGETKKRTLDQDDINGITYLYPFGPSDTTAPSSPISLSPAPSSWTNTDFFSIDWTNPSDPSGIAGAYYKLGSAPASNTDGTYTTSKPFFVTATAQGGQVLYVWLRDGAANTSYLNTSSTTLYYDGTPPANGSLNTAPGNAQVSLSWSGFSDGGGSGLKSTNTYKVVRSTGTYPSSQCTNGTQVYLGSGSSTTDPGLINGTVYYYRACAYDKADNVSPGATALATPQAADTIPPTPNPLTWATAPHQTGTTSIAMVALIASDPTAPINYFFDFVDSPTGGTGGLDSGWQSGTSYTNSGLQVNHRYGYRVKARDGANNETGYSTPTRYVYTAIETPTGISLGAVSSTSIQVQSTNTPSGLNRGSSGLLIENTTKVTSSGWKQDNSFWTSNPLSPNTSYGFRAKARNADALETGYTSTVSKYTLANVPGVASFSNITQTCIRANWTANGNSGGTRYYCENQTLGTSSGWTTNLYWDSCTLSCGTSYSFRVRAKNGEGVETDWTLLGSQNTQACSLFTISGTVTSGEAGLSGVSMSGLPGNPVTGADGSYSGTVDYRWSGAVTPQKTGYNFSPYSQPYSNVTSNQTQNYMATLNSYTVMASVEGDPSGGLVTPSSRTVNHGASATFAVTTNTGYTASVSEGTLSGTTWIIPNVTSTHTTTVTFTLNSYTISGLARTSGGTGISDVVMDGLPGNPVTGDDGFYSATIPYNWSGIVVPTRSGYKFNPHSIHYVNVIEDRITDDCIGQPIQSFQFFDDFSTDKGWIGETGGWERGPAVSGVSGNGNPDPEMDYSASDDNYILGFVIGGDYPNDLIEESGIISPPIDCSGQNQVFLKFRRYLNVEGNEFDHARIYLSINGMDWTKVWENPPIDLMDNEWVPAVFDISSIAANQATVYIKFTMGPTNSSRQFSGWNIDDFEVTSEAIYPSEGAYGTDLVIWGSGFGLKKGKVFIESISQSTSLTVLDWTTGTSIKSLLNKILEPGIYNVTIQPKEGDPIIYENAFALRPAEIHSIEQGEGSSYDQVTIKGRFFGTKKGKVYLEYEEEKQEEEKQNVRKSCKVTKWWMDPVTNESEISLIVPKMLPEVCDVVVDPYGAIPDAEDEKEDGFTVKAPEIESVSPNIGSTGDPVTIHGHFFGTKKGKVYLGYEVNGIPKKKSCSVVSWTVDPTTEEGDIVFVVPKGLSAWTYDLIVTNSVGSSLPTIFTVN